MTRIRSALLRLLAVAIAMVAAGTATATSTAGAIGFQPIPYAIIPALPYGGIVPFDITFDGSQSICVEGCTIVAWDWLFGDGTAGSGAVVSHRYTTSGMFVASLTVTANTGHTDTEFVVVNSFANTQAVMSASTLKGMAPLTVTFDGSASVTNWDRTLTHRWNFGDGTSATGPTVTHTYTVPGTHNVSLTVTDSAGTSQTVGDYVYVQDPLVAPGQVSATTPQRRSVVLRWTNRMVGVAQLVVERCTGAKCTNFAPVWTLPPGSTTHTDQGLRSGTTYRYRIRVRDYLDRTAASAIVTVKAR